MSHEDPLEDLITFLGHTKRFIIAAGVGMLKTDPKFQYIKIG